MSDSHATVGRVPPRTPLIAGALVIACALATSPAPAQGQAAGAWDGPWTFAATVGGANPAPGFGTPNRCMSPSDAWAGEAALSVRRGLGAHLGVEAGVSFSSVLGRGERCFVVAPQPPNMTGTTRTTALRHGDADGEFLRTGLRAVARVAKEDGEFRLALGGDYAPWQRAYGPTAGASAAFGTGPVRLVLQGEGWWPTFPMQTSTMEWEEGTVVSSSTEKFRTDRQENWAVRIGLEYHPRSRRVR